MTAASHTHTRTQTHTVDMHAAFKIILVSLLSSVSMSCILGLMSCYVDKYRKLLVFFVGFFVFFKKRKSFKLFGKKTNNYLQENLKSYLYIVWDAVSLPRQAW